MKPKGTAILIGGGEDRGEENKPEMKDKNREFEQFDILKTLIPEKNHRSRRIEIITTASSLPDEMNKMYSAAFKKIGFREIGFMKIESKTEARDPVFAERISSAHAVLFTGGDQFTLAALIGGTDVMHAIIQRYTDDKDFIVAGTSAGAMVMSKVMLYDGQVSEALLKDDLRISSGLGILDGCIIDTHFVKRGRIARLVNAVIMNPMELGIGLGEDSSLIIKNGDEAECGGSGSVFVIDGNEIGKTNITDVEEDEPIFVENLKLHLLAKGCRFSLKERKMLGPVRPRKKTKVET